MNLQTKPDFDKTLQRFEAWWQCEIIDRPPVNIGIKSDRLSTALPPAPTPKNYPTHRQRWWDIDAILDRVEFAAANTTWFADNYPSFMPNLGPDLVATAFGCELDFADHTSWSKPIIPSCRDILNIQPDFDNPYWQWICRATDLSLQRGRGKWITALPDLHTNGDLLAALRGPEELCLELIDDPDAVRDACDHVTSFFPAIFDHFWAPLAAQKQPATTWAAILHDGPAYVTSCDFICMISPTMFSRAILPSIQREMASLQRNIFHLDGPGALKHLDAILAQPALTGLQWVAGDGQGPAGDWIDVYKKAQAAGKCIQLIARSIDDAKAVAQHLGPRGVWFCVWNSYPLDEAQAFLDWTAAWAAQKT